MRQRILRRLDRDGPATATSLARALGENTGATSYHLRQLAEHGFVEDDASLGQGRERWWRARPQDVRFPPRSRTSAALRHELDRFEQQNAAEDIEALARFQAHRERLGDWGDALLFARGELRLTFEQTRQFWEDYMALFNRYAAAAPGTDARTLLVRFMAHPDVG